MPPGTPSRLRQLSYQCSLLQIKKKPGERSAKALVLADFFLGPEGLVGKLSQLPQQGWEAGKTRPAAVAAVPSAHACRAFGADTEVVCGQ